MEREPDRGAAAKGDHDAGLKVTSRQSHRFFIVAAAIYTLESPQHVTLGFVAYPPDPWRNR